ncbi:MAG TPA: NAD(P)/FAD-dependent oxidoreductase [Pyrinomonadaceae bacterium]|nr:NAD(P)/FAD-dependent oxidoreductase [Pyrinomonadaceae bacterium]
MMSHQLHTAIVGGGVAGLAMANALAARGISSTVFERTSSPGEIDRGDVIHHSILEIFKTWGAYELLKKYNPLEFSRFFVLNHKGSRVFSFDLSRDFDPPASFTVLRHPEIQRMLEEAATKSGLVEVEHNNPCVELLQERGRVVGIRTVRGRVDAKFTVIANGARSSLRDKYFSDRDYHRYPVSFYNCRFNRVSEFNDAGYYILGKNGVMIAAPLPNNETRIGIQEYDANAGERLSPKNIIRVISQRLQTLSAKSLEFIDAHRYPLSKSLSRSFWIPGAALIGDAAHTTHPAGGQGMNLAFQDAEVLAQALARTDASDWAVDKACEAYSQRRHSEVKKVLIRTHFMGLMSTIESPLFNCSREVLLRLANKSVPLKRVVFRRIVDVR